ncbi:hypothetical protein UA08_03538 [Talaromyces atroroseus]|uniref:RING-type domain-containing protein n=1 Tax=Talaromyces atroroseus TaxID=1441469 RepID=A0A225AT81_TALAT|nr:hypothetical protein UA08_03538 [Talaromyces atroroseus]OKL61564.1 hypothetical protein UA08_03538 [Talaromyces atroroseus]
MPQRQSSAVIDLTSNQIDFNAQPGPSSHPNASPERRSVKRRRVDGGGASGSFPSYSAGASSSSDELSAPRPLAEAEDDQIEAVDLTEINDDNSLAKVLAKQREDAIKAQAATEDREGRTTLTATKCAICMDTPTDATTTVCGHMFCHKCIIDSLRYEEGRSETTTGKASRGKCPACRKLLSRKDTPGPRRDLIPLQFKLKQPS